MQTRWMKGSGSAWMEAALAPELKWSETWAEVKSRPLCSCIR